MIFFPCIRQLWSNPSRINTIEQWNPETQCSEHVICQPWSWVEDPCLLTSAQCLSIQITVNCPLFSSLGHVSGCFYDIQVWELWWRISEADTITVFAIYIYISQIHIYIYTWIFARNSSVDLYFCVLLCEFLFFFHWICWMGRGLAGSVGVCCSGKTDFNIQKKNPLVYMEIKRFLIIVIAEFLQGKVCFCWRKRY